MNKVLNQQVKITCSQILGLIENIENALEEQIAPNAIFYDCHIARDAIEHLLMVLESKD